MIGDRIKIFREQSGKSQEELAHDSGVHANTIARWERGEMNPRGTSIAKIALALNITPNDLLGETDNPERPQASAASVEPAHQIESNAHFSDSEMVPVPVSSNDVKVCCGAGNIYPDEIIWEDIGTYPVPASFLMGYDWQVGDGGYHIVTVDGDSMEPRVPNGSRILLADIHPNNGDLAVILYKGRMLLRGVLFEKERIRLRAWNKEYEDIVVPDNELEDLCFLGKMLGIVLGIEPCSSMW